MGGRFFVALLGWVLGVTLQLQQAALWLRWSYVGCTVVGLVALWLLFASPWLDRGRLRQGGRMSSWIASAATRPVLLVGAAVLLAWGQVGWRAVAIEQQRLPPQLEGVDVLLTGVVEELPQRVAGGQRFVFRLEQFERIGGAAEPELASPIALPPRLRLTWYDDPDESSRPAVRAGERWRLPARLRAPHGLFNPHAFDYELWLWEQGLRATGYVRVAAALPPPLRLGQTTASWVDRARQHVRDGIEAHIASQRQPERLAGVLAALVVGDQGAIEADDWLLFRDTGIAHLMAVSGMHITMFAWLAVPVISWLWRRSVRLSRACPAPQAALLGGAALAAAYAVFSGWGIPAQRTVWMLTMAVALRLSGRQWPLPMMWLAALALVLALDPWALLQAGFWLSFVAVGVLFAGGPPRSSQVHLRAGEALGRPAWRQAGRWTILQVQATWREQWLMTLALAPLTLLLFQQFPVIGILVNLLAIPYVSFVILPLALAGVAWPGLWSLAAWLLSGMMAALDWFASWPWAVWQLPARPLWLALPAVLAGVVLTLRWPWAWKLGGVPVLLLFLLWRPDAPKEGEFEVTALDVGQGQAVLIRTRSHALLYDTGPRYGHGGDRSDAGQRVLVPYLQAHGVRLSRVMLSHIDTDHIGGAAAVLRAQPQADWLGSVPSGHALQRERPGRPCRHGQQWRWDAVRFRVLWPATVDEAAMQARPNAQSCVLLVDNGRHAVLLPGDIGVRQEQQLVAQLAAEADVPPFAGLLMPHHGSRSSSSVALLQALRPRWAVAQAGYRNPFRHPAPAVVARYQRHGITVFDSPRCGAWQWRSVDFDDGRCARMERRRYWHHHGHHQP